MDTLLKNFHRDEHTREAVKTFIFATLDKYALEKVYEKEETRHLADAKEVINKVFRELYESYEEKKEKEVLNSAR